MSGGLFAKVLEDEAGGRWKLEQQGVEDREEMSTMLMDGWTDGSL